MVGYHERYEYLGKVAARCDDLLNLVPARLTAVVLALGAALTGSDALRAGAMAWRDHAKTASPNAGWPMSAMAGALGVQLEKDEHFARARSEVRRARAYLVEALTVLGLRVVPPSANYLLVDVGDAPTVRAALLHRGICVRDCSSFGLPCHVRVGVRTLPECGRLVAAFAAARIPEMVEANRICRGEPTGSGG
jgi:hypothetical protein